VIVLEYDAKSGVAGGTIGLIPEVRNGSVSWRCETPSYVGIAAIVPECRYVGPLR
jgi:hypothetical protein